MTTSSDPRPAALLSERDMTREYGINPKTLQKWRHDRTSTYGPPYVKLGNLVRYRRNAVEAWIEARTVTPGGSRTTTPVTDPKT